MVRTRKPITTRNLRHPEYPNVPENKSGKVENATKIFYEYSENSTIHGFRYLCERNRGIFERIFWLIIFSVSIVFCYNLIHAQWAKWNDNPVILTFDTKLQDIYEIPFPAVTVCPVMKFKTNDLQFRGIFPKINDLIANTSMYDEEMIKKLFALTHICPMSPIFQRLRQMEPTTYLCDDFQIVDTLHELNYSHTMQILKFDRFVPIYQFDGEFTKIITDEGICYTFNILDGSDLFQNDTVYNKYENQKLYLTGGESTYWLNYSKSELVYPFHSAVAGKQGGLNFEIFGERLYDELVCEPLVEGYKIIIHSNEEYPRVISESYINVPYNHKLELAITPKVIQSSSSIKHLKLHQRQCFLAKERELLYFKAYTQQNCEFECLVNFTIQLCNCTRFFMPHLKDIQICGLKKIWCYENAYREILYQKVFLENPTLLNCNCLPLCSTINYDLEKYITSIDLSKAIKNSNWMMATNSTTYDNFFVNSFYIFFKESQFIAMKRSELYGWTDFLGNFGGLLGLFMGISFLSFIEIFYFFIIRTLADVIED